MSLAHIQRTPEPQALSQLQAACVHPVLARLWASRGIDTPLSPGLAQLLPPNGLDQIEKAAEALSHAIIAGQHIVIVGDYDCDGATACCVAVLGLRMMGARVDFLVPNRFETGYGLSPEVVDQALQMPQGKPDLLITVDNGIASIEGVKAAKAHGIDVIITDHHLQADELPDALAIVNPNQHSCHFSSKNLAGVGVIFYVLMMLRKRFRDIGRYTTETQPNLAQLLDLVALGTVADVVRLDQNNRLLVREGLRRIRSGQTRPGIKALLKLTNTDYTQTTTHDLGFRVAPRINAAGRLADMSIGIHLLLAETQQQADEIAYALEDMNKKRREIEMEMRQQAEASIAECSQTGPGLCIYDPEWHQGVIGIVASRIKDKYFKPTIAFARADDGMLRGSGRSVPDVHLRDVLDLVSKRHPELIKAFGGHAMAAGLTIPENALEAFEAAFNEAIIEFYGEGEFEQIIETDGSLPTEDINIEVAQMLSQEIWGAGFPEPSFCDTFNVVGQTVLKDTHLKLQLEKDRQYFDAIWFYHNTPLKPTVKLAYKLNAHTWNGNTSVQLMIRDEVI